MRNLPALWLAAKEAERVAVEERRRLEDEMTSLFGIPSTLEGTENLEQDGYKVKVVGRMNRKVDADILNELARENGLERYVNTLFRWSAEVNTTQWKNTHSDITSKLAGAITTTPGRPSFSISVKEAQD